MATPVAAAAAPAGPPFLITARSEAGVETFYGPEQGFRKHELLSSEKATLFEYSADGRLLVIGTASELRVFDTIAGTLLQTLPQADVLYVSFSPAGSFLCAAHRLPKEGRDNIVLWEVRTGQRRAAWTQKLLQRETWPVLKWTEDETAFGRMVTGEVLFFSRDDPSGQPVQRLKLPDIGRFAVAAGPPPHHFATFIPEKKGAPARVQIYSYPQLELMCSKSFFKASEVDLMWNSLGSALLVSTHTDVDRTGKSYYGESGLYFLSADGKIDQLVQLKTPGPVHDCVWTPSGKEFVVVYGFMPNPQTTLFDLKCQPVADFGAAARNTAKISPNGRVCVVGGFGNLSGQMEFWDPRRLKRIGTAEARCAAYLDWSPDSRYLLTAVLSPRMHTDNGFRVWSYDGTPLHQQPIHELFQVEWRPTPPQQYADRPISPRLYSAARAPQAVAASQPAKYVPPHAKDRSSTSAASAALAALRLEGAAGAADGPRKYSAAQTAARKQQQDLPPGYDPTDEAKPKRNKKRRGKKATAAGGKTEDAESGSDDEGTPAAAAVAAAAAPAAAAVAPVSKQPAASSTPAISAFQIEEPEDASSLDKKIKAIAKKLRQIESLAEAGKSRPLSTEETKKLAGADELRRELAALEAKRTGK